MDLSLFLAKVWGLVFIILPLSMMINKGSIAKMYHLAREEGLLILMGFLSLVVGLLSVIGHNIWVFDWPVIITIFGWIALIKGLMFLFFPGAARKQMESLERGKWSMLLLLIAFLVGIYLSYVGFFT